MGSDSWSGLAADLSCLIVDRLTSPDDRNNFRRVCTSWGLVSKHYPQLFRSPGIPWLMLSSRGLNQSPKFYNILDKKIYTMRLPEMQPSIRVTGSSVDGWVVCVDGLLKIHAYNLMTKKTIQLPSLTTFPQVKGCGKKDGCDGYYVIDKAYPFENGWYHTLPPTFMSVECMQAYFFDNAIVLPPSMSTATRDGEKRHMVALNYTSGNMMAFAADGDDSWTVLSELTLIYSFLVHKGLLYMYSGCRSSFISFNFSSPTDVCRYGKAALPQLLFNGDKYLVEIEDEIWLVLSEFGMYTYQETKIKKADSVKVMKLDSEKNTWVEMTSIGDYAIFIGNNHPVAVSTKGFPDLQKDCIYFTDDCARSSDIHPKIYNVGLFNLCDGSFKSFFDNYDIQKSLLWWSPSWVWMVPNHELQQIQSNN